MSKETPMMQQYKAIKQDQQDAILFFRLGDFYEMFLDDAKEASRILNLVLTSRSGIPMCGIPYHASKTYIKRLIDAGKKVAICEQTELPKKGKGIVRREVTQIITPGTVIDDDFLDAAKNNYICAIACHTHGVSCSYADLSTGEFKITDLKHDGNFDRLKSLLEKVQPSELLIQESLYYENASFRMIIEHSDAMVTKYPDWFFSRKDAYETLKKHFKTISLKQFGIVEDDDSLLSAGVLYAYFLQNAKQQLQQILQISLYDENRYVSIDESAQKNLELLRNLQDGSEKYTLFQVLKHTKSAAGTRLLREWIVHPLYDLAAIKERQQKVLHFYQDQQLQNDAREYLSKVLDLERLTTRIMLHRSLPRDVLAISQTIEAVRSLLHAHPEVHEAYFLDVDKQMLIDVYELSDRIATAINPDIKGPFEEGKIIQEGFNAKLDTLRSMRDQEEKILEDYLAEIKQKTGITNMRLKSNKIIGHFIEVTKSQTNLVPDYFLRKQTLVHGERYTTNHLIEIERSIYESKDRSEALEKELYEKLLEDVRLQLSVLLKLSHNIAILDCYQSFAYSAMKWGYVLPEVVSDNVLQINNGRHPVVESIMEPGSFIPNSIHIQADANRLALITGPNMSGKSTYLRQIALIVLLSHMGSFVPADSACIGLTDKVFCRVGASDNLVRGESTFLVEMNETAYILRNATRNSLVIMDEVGRGTSTDDGLAIAYAVLNKLLQMEIKTLFATHYHELTTLQHEQLQKLYLDIADDNGTIIFLKRIREGVAASSYGIHVAELAGIPHDVLQIARTYQEKHKGSGKQPELFLVCDTAEQGKTAKKKEYDHILEHIEQIDIDSMTPLESLLVLKELKDEISRVESQ